MRPRMKLSGLTWALGILAMAGVFASCGDDSTTLPTACEGPYAALCGRPCSAISPCPTGLFCSPDGTCTAECGPGAAPCPSGLSCTTDGRCALITDSGAGGSFLDSQGTGGGGSGGDACGDISVTTDPVIPTVMLLVDQSGSMTESFSGGMDRWEAAYDALMNPNRGVVAQLEGEVRFGLTLYTSHNGFENGRTCPELIEVPIALNNYTAIDNAYSGESAQEDTPTGESIDAIVPDVLAVTDPGPKIIVLATDGEPDSCDVPDPSWPDPAGAEARDLSIQAAQDAHGAGIDLFVVSVGDQVGLDHLQEMANAGVGRPIDAANGAPYYVANDPAELQSAFEQIIGGVRGCVFTLNGSVEPGMEDRGSVLLDGGPLGYNDPDGWQLNNPSEIELLGASCDTFMDGGSHQLDVTFPCGTVVINPPR